MSAKPLARPVCRLETHPMPQALFIIRAITGRDGCVTLRRDGKYPRIWRFATFGDHERNSFLQCPVLVAQRHRDVAERVLEDCAGSLDEPRKPKPGNTYSAETCIVAAF